MNLLEVTISKKEFKRIFSKILVDSDDPFTKCWTWTGSLDQQGYGLLWYRRRTERIHRVLYAFFIHPIPRGTKETRTTQLDHICNNRACCNPHHLRIVTQRINTLRGNGPSAINFRKTHCKHGHKLPDRDENGERKHYCPTCDLIRHKTRIEGQQREYWLQKAREAAKRYYSKHPKKT